MELVFVSRSFGVGKRKIEKLENRKRKRLMSLTSLTSATEHVTCNGRYVQPPCGLTAAFMA